MGRADDEQVGALVVGHLVQAARGRDRGVDCTAPSASNPSSAGIGEPQDLLRGLAEGPLDHADRSSRYGTNVRLNGAT